MYSHTECYAHAPTDQLLGEVIRTSNVAVPLPENHDITAADELSGSRYCQILQDAYQEAEDGYTFSCNLKNILNKTACGVLILLMSFVVSLGCLVIGIMKFHACPCEPMLPVFLTINGAALFVKSFLQSIKIGCDIAPPRGERHALYTIIDVLAMFLAFWCLTGSVLVYSLLEKVQTSDVKEPRFCDVIPLYLALAVVIMTFLGIILTAIFYIVSWIIYQKMEKSPNFKKYKIEFSYSEEDFYIDYM